MEGQHFNHHTHNRLRIKKLLRKAKISRRKGNREVKTWGWVGRDWEEGSKRIGDEKSYFTEVL